MSLESALWEATRPAFRVRYIHDPTSTPRVPLYASYGFATGPTARAKLARIVRKAPEVVVKVTGRQRGGHHVKAHLDYIGRKGVRTFLEKHQGMNATPEVFAAHVARQLDRSVKPEQVVPPERSNPNKGRSR